MPVKHKPKSLMLVTLALFLLLLKMLVTRMTMTKFQNSEGFVEYKYEEGDRKSVV